MGNEHQPTIWEEGPEELRETKSLQSEAGSDEAAEDSGGFVLGRFEDLEFLAKGGVGKIHTGVDPEIGRRVAIKVLRPEIESNRVQLEKFRNEARITGLLEHPNIVPVHEAGESPDGRVYFSMKWVQGESLAELLAGYGKIAAQQGGLIDPTPFLKYLLKVCDALSFAHDRGVVHRDLKPENLMIGRFGEVLVMDWGLARSIRSDQEIEIRLDESIQINSRRTQDGIVQGTPAYMPPEQARGEWSEVDEQSDVYSMGAILYEIVTGSPPQGEGTAKEVLNRLLRKPLVPPRKRAPRAQIPVELEAVVMKAMAPEKQDRYPDAKAFQADIQAYLDGRVLDAARYTSLQLFIKWVGRNRKMCTGAAAVLALSLTVFGLTKWSEWRDQEERFAAEWTAAKRFVADAGEVTKPTGEFSVIDLDTGLEHREIPSQRERREETMKKYAKAARALERALRLRPDAAEVQEMRREVGEKIGLMALVGRDFFLARESFEQLENYGAKRADIERWVERVENARSKRLKWRGDRLRSILKDITLGLSRAGRPAEDPLLPDYVFEAASYRDLQTATILGENLGQLIVKAKKGGGTVAWSQTERDRATFICRVLGRLGLPECVDPLGEWLVVVVDPRLAVEAGQALCNTRHRAAQPYLVSGRNHLGINSDAWKQIQRFFNRVPEVESSKDPSSADTYFKRGLVYAGKKMYDEAIASYTRAIENNPRNTSAYVNRGNVREDKGDVQGAIADYSKAIEIDPRHAFAYNNRGLARNLLGDSDGAIEDYNKALEIDPTHANTYVNRGNARIGEGDLSGAMEDFVRAIEIAPRKWAAYSARAHVHMAQGNLSGAMEDYNRVLDIDPRNAFAYTNRGRVRQAKGDLSGAIADYDRSVEIDPRVVSTYVNRGLARKAKGDPNGAIEDYNKAIELDPKYANAYVNRGLAKKAKGDLKGAIEDFSKAIEVAPKYANAYVNRGLVKKAKGDLNGAIEDYNKAIEVAPEYANAYVNRGLVKKAKGDLNGAIEDFSKAIEVAPKYASAYVNRGITRLIKGDRNGAMDDFNKAIEVDPKHALAYVNRGFARQAKRDFRGAMDDFNKAIELDPADALTYVDRGNTRRKIKDFQGAIADYTRAIQLNLKSVGVYISRGAIYCDVLREYDRAIFDFEQAIKLDPKLVVAYKNRGVARSGKGDLQGAIEDYSKAIELDPKDASAYYFRGLARNKKGDVDGGIEDFNKAIELAPKYALAYVSRGLARKARRDLRGAIEDFNKAIELDPKDVLTHVDRGNVRSEMKDFQGAIKDFSKAIQLAPKSVWGYISRGATYCDDLKDYDRAIIDFTQAIELDPKSAVAYKNRGIARSGKGDLQGAIADYEKALEVAPANWRLRRGVEDDLARARKNLAGSGK